MRATRTLALAGMLAPVLFITLVIVQGVLAARQQPRGACRSARSRRGRLHGFRESTSMSSAVWHDPVRRWLASRCPGDPWGVIGFALLLVSATASCSPAVFLERWSTANRPKTPHVAAAIMSGCRHRGRLDCLLATLEGGSAVARHSRRTRCPVGHRHPLLFVSSGGLRSRIARRCIRGPAC